MRSLLGKLKSRWSGPFILTKVFVSCVVEKQDPGNYNTFKVNNQRLKIYSGYEIPTVKVCLILTKP